MILYEFFWGTYCDWYLEMMKGRFDDINDQKAAYVILKNTLKMLHPFIPFVTEELYSEFEGAETILTLEPWPLHDDTLVDTAADASVNILIDLSTGIRNARSQWGIKPQDEITCILTAEHFDATLKDNLDVLKRLLKISSFDLRQGNARVRNAATGVAGPVTFFIPLGDVIDVTKERVRIEVEVDQQEKAAAGIEGRLANAGFVNKAPVDVIAKERERLVELRSKSSDLRKTLASLV